MLEFMQDYIGKECLVYTMNSQLAGTVRELRDGWLLLDNGQGVEAVNLDYIVRVRPYPKDRKGKKKSVVLD